MKKGVCFIMSAFLCLACMGAAGCSGNGGNNENNNGGNTEDYTPLPEYDLQEFVLDKYVSPVWQGTVSYAEAAFVMENEAGEIAPLRLLYPIKNIVSVRSADLKTKYTEGVDFEVGEDGTLKILSGGNIPYLRYSDYYHETYTDDGLKTQIPAAAPTGAYIVAETTKDSPGMSAWCLAVAYTHAQETAVAKPADKSATFSRFAQKLERGEEIKVAYFGDSITDGWGSTAFAYVDRAPYCPMYADLAMDKLEQKYGVTITRKNFSVSGNTSQQSYESPKMDEVCAENSDLVVVAFGMNDGAGRPVKDFSTTMQQIINKITKSSPDTEIVVVLSMLPNEKVGFSQGSTLRIYHEDYPEEFAKLEEKWASQGKHVAVANVTEVHKHILQRKKFQDTTSSNTNHPNDYMHRVYAQTLLRTLVGDNVFFSISE